MQREWPLVGRASELDSIESAIRHSPRGPRGIVLSGTAGVGKTRLAVEALGRARRRGIGTKWAVASYSAQRLPWGALAAHVGPVSGGTHEAVRDAVSALTAGSAAGGMVIGVDDVHLIDQFSALAIHHLVLSGAATVLLTLREGAPAPDAVTALWKDGYLERLDLAPLTSDKTEALLTDVLGGPVEATSVERLWSMSEGSALYLRHLVDGEVDAGRLSPRDGIWYWAGPPTLTPALQGLIGQEMGMLPEATMEVVDLLTVSEPLPLPVLYGLAARDSVEVAESAGLIALEDDGRQVSVRLAHPMYGEMRRARMGSMRGQRLSGVIATALLARQGDSRDRMLRCAVLLMDSDLDLDHRFMTAAAHAAMELTDLVLAADLARAAIAAGGGFAPRMILGYATTWLGRGVEAEQVLGGLTGLEGNDIERAQVANARAGNLHWALGRPESATAVLDEAESGINDDELRRALYAMRSAFAASTGWPSRAIEAAEIVLGGEPPPQAVGLASVGLVCALGAAGRGDEVRAEAARGYAAAAQSFDAVGVATPLEQFHLHAMEVAGYLDEVDRLALAEESGAVVEPGPPQVHRNTMRGRAALARGRLGAAADMLRRSRVIADRFSNGMGNNLLCLLGIVQALAMVGDVAGSASALVELEIARHPAYTYLDVDLMLARAWVWAAEGADSLARKHARRAADFAATRGQFAEEARALHTAVCFGDEGCASRLVELAGFVDGPRVAIAAAQAQALAQHDGAALDSVARRWTQMGDLRAAADAQAQAASAHERGGRRGSAITARAAAMRLADDCGGASTPALRAVESPSRLTNRQREICELVGMGLSNREIADKLVVSIRTVEGHVYRASRILGAGQRTQLGDAVRARRSPP